MSLSMNNQESLVSIITPSYNSSKFITDSIKSVISQTYSNWEMLIVDDNSTDDSVKIIKQHTKQEPRIKLIELKKNVGAAIARNKALEQATGQYIAFLDSDDIWLPKKLEKQITFMTKNQYAFTFTAYKVFSENGKKDYHTINVPKKLTYSDYCKNTIIGCLTVIIDKEVMGDFRMKNIRSSHDMALWLELLKRGHSAYGLNEVLAKYRLVSTSNTSKKYIAAKEVWDVYRKVEELTLIKSSWFFLNYVFHALKKRL
jgi:teichuronic acid biosynthesis glycosyltransferase TuaG